MKARFAGSHPLQAALIALGLAGISYLAPAQTIFNASFESNSFTINPGYISGNVPIVGWTAGNTGGAGLNPASGNPFADNGTIPDGANVAFIQNSPTSSLSTVISNLTVGETYKVNFRVNARSAFGGTPNLKVSIGGTNIINSVVTPVGANPYKFFAFDFTAAATNQTMTLSNDASGDQTVLVDNFSIAVRDSGWSYAAWNDDVSSGVEVAPSNYTHAFNFDSVSNATINGVTFTGIAGINPSHLGSNAFSTSGLNMVSTDTNKLTTGTGGSAVLAHDFLWNGNPATLTVSNLTVGKSYVTTIYSVGYDASGARAATFGVGNDRLTVNQDQFGDNKGLWVSYFFTATATSNTITYTPLQGTSTFHTYGFANYESPPLQIVNPSFEADTFTNSPGYSSNNFPITGWNGVGRLGVNPGANFGPFTDNGDIPDGTKAAFIQGDSNYNGMLTQTIHGFTNGASYQVRYFENSRNCCSGTVPFAEVRLGGQTVIAPHAVPPVFSGAYHHVFSDPFIATNTTLKLAFLKSNPQGGDTTLLIDNVSISRVTSNQPPVAFTLPADLLDTNSVQLNGEVGPEGSPTVAWFQWGTDTNYGNVTAPQTAGSNWTTVTSLSAVVSGLAQDSHYRMVASNAFGISAGADQVISGIPGSFVIPIPGLPLFNYASVAWGDFDNDGRLDFVITGTTNDFYDGAIAQLWRNTGSGFTNVPIPGLPEVAYGCAAWGDYDNDGRLDFLITGQDTNGDFVSQLWRNTGNGFSNETDTVAPGLPGVYYSAVAWGDFDNDGRLDFLIVGASSNSQVSQLWRNTASGFTNVPIPGLPQLLSGSVAWSDYDNDGRLDFLIIGSDYNYKPFSQLWRNTGSGFTNVPIPGLPQISYGSVAWGDFDNDGRLDFLFTGLHSITNIGDVYQDFSQLWRNTGSGFTNVPIPGLPGVQGGLVAWGDFDNDGRLDFLITGDNYDYTNSQDNFIAQLWRNTGSGFSNVTGTVAPDLPAGYGSGSLAWGDFDNDGRLDFLITWYDFYGDGIDSEVWRNNLPGSNTPPAAPTSLSAILSSNTVTLNWTAPVDDHTPAAGLNYNLRIGSTPGGSDILAPQALGSGTRLVPQIGNAGPGLSATYQFTPVANHYYWSVQAVDTSLAGSPFAAEAQFYLLPLLIQPMSLSNGVFQFTFTNTYGGTWDVRATTNPVLSVSGWADLGPATPLGSNLYRFTDVGATNFAKRYYLLQKQ